jgi:glycosyltransferase involved in cell wall biosynthesis
MIEKISVVIPTYNRFDSLIRAVESVINQTYKNLEILIVDDNSTDMRYELLDEKFNNDKIKIIHLPVNMREKYNVNHCQGMTRNVGVENSTGDYIAFLDDDDYWVDMKKLENQLDYMKKYNVLISGTNMTVSANHKELYPGLPNCNSPTLYTFEYLKNCNILANSTVLVQKNILVSTGCQKAEIHEDYMCWLRIVEITGSFLFIPDVTTYYEKNFSQFYYNDGIDVEKNNNLQESETTIVTCYYTIPSKFNDEIYWNWMKNFLQLDCNLVIYTDEKNYEKLKYERRNKSTKTFLYIREIRNFYVYKYIDFWNYCKSIDIEQKHTPELYMLWAEKSFMCFDAVINNNFKSKYYFWVDIGCVRYSSMLKDIVSFPKIPEEFKKENKFILSIIENFNESDKVFDNNREISNIFQNINNRCCNPIVRIQGGFFGGHKDWWKQWTHLYKNEIEIFIKNKTFGGKDQYIMANIILTKNPDFIKTVKLSQKGSDQWFSFLYHFS